MGISGGKVSFLWPHVGSLRDWNQPDSSALRVSVLCRRASPGLGSSHLSFPGGLSGCSSWCCYLGYYLFSWTTGSRDNNHAQPIQLQAIQPWSGHQSAKPRTKSDLTFVHHILKMKVLVAQSCLTLCNPMDYSPPGSSVLGLLQARLLEWAAMPSSRGSSQSRDRSQVSCIAGRLFTIWATREAPTLPNMVHYRVPSLMGHPSIIWYERSACSAFCPLHAYHVAHFCLTDAPQTCALSCYVSFFILYYNSWNHSWKSTYLNKMVNICFIIYFYFLLYWVFIVVHGLSLVMAHGLWL